MKKLSLPVKIIIFILFAVIAFGIGTYIGFGNFGGSKGGVANKQNPAAELTSKKVKETADAQNKKEEQEKVKAHVELWKGLDEKYKKAYQSFYEKAYWQAVSICEEILRDDDTYYKAHNLRGISLCYLGKYIDGMESIEKALTIKNDYGFGRYNKALAFELYAHYDEAIGWYDKALEVENYSWSYYGKAKCYAKKGDNQNALKNLKTAIEMQADVKTAARAESVSGGFFEKLRGNAQFQQLTK